MRIEIKERGSEAFYRETVNVAAQYQRLLKNPKRKLGDLFKNYRNSGILSVVAFALLAILMILWGSDTIMIVAEVVLAINIVLSIMLFRNMKKLLGKLQDDPRTSVFSMDDRGIELDKEGAQIVRIAWDNLAFVRAFKESICFASKEGTGITISIDRKYENEIRQYMTEHVPSIEII